jgi:hypothetical protein
MADDGFGGERFDVIANGQVIVEPAKPGELEYVKAKVHFEADKSHPFHIIYDPKLEGNRKVDLTLECFDKVFEKTKRGGENNFDQGLIITVYPVKKPGDWFQHKYKIPAVADRRDQAPVQGFKDGKKPDLYSSSLRVGPSVYDIIKDDIDKTGGHALLHVSLKKKKVTIWSGVSGKSPVKDYNLGWKFAYISLLMSIPITLLSMLGEAYHIPENLRTGLEWVIGGFGWLFHWVASQIG